MVCHGVTMAKCTKCFSCSIRVSNSVLQKSVIWGHDNKLAGMWSWEDTSTDLTFDSSAALKSQICIPTVFMGFIIFFASENKAVFFTETANYILLDILYLSFLMDVRVGSFDIIQPWA